MSSWLTQRVRMRYGLRVAVFVVSLFYLTTCLLLFARQRYILYQSQPNLSNTPNSLRFGNSLYEDVWIPASDTEKIHGLWLPAPNPDEYYRTISNEPVAVVDPAKVVLLFCGVGHNMGDSNYVARATALRQLGFSVLVFDYRGRGWSDGGVPTEARLYEDGEIVWNYLRDLRGVRPENVVIYGESLGGAIALNVAVNHPEASALILQSTFTTMTNAINSRLAARLFPIDWLLTERFDSLSKIKQVEMPVLFIHGSNDSVVSAQMSRELYEATPTSKQLFFVRGADHIGIYRPRFKLLYESYLSFYLRRYGGQSYTR